MPTPKAVIFGAAILDIPAGPVDSAVFASGSHPVERIRLGYGGDALNQATVLTRLNQPVRLVSQVGNDDAGSLLLAHCHKVGLDTSYIPVVDGLDTGINLVLVSPDGERSFVTSRNGSLRSLKAKDLPPSALDGVQLLSFASIFVLPHFGPAELAELFSAAKAKGITVCADITKRKKGETVDDMRPAFAHVDWLFPNYAEAAMLTGKTALDDVADALLEAGVKQVAIKTGQKGCFLKGSGLRVRVPAMPGIQAVDTTGAGDTFAAGFLCGLLEGHHPRECAALACAAASLSVQSFGATDGVGSREQVEQRLAAYYAALDV